MIYRGKYFHDNITVSILAYRGNRADDNTVDTTNIKSLSAMQCSGCNIGMYGTTCIVIVDYDLLGKKLTFPSINPAVLAQ